MWYVSNDEESGDGADEIRLRYIEASKGRMQEKAERMGCEYEPGECGSMDA